MQKSTKIVLTVVVLLTAWAAYSAMPRTYSTFSGYRKTAPLIVIPVKTVRTSNYSSGGSSYGK